MVTMLQHNQNMTYDYLCFQRGMCSSEMPPVSHQENNMVSICFVNTAKDIKTAYKVKPYTHHVAYNFKKNLWTISTLSTEKLKIRYLGSYIALTSRHLSN